MSKISSFFFLVSILLASAVAHSDEPKKAPTLEQALQFLKSKLEAYADPKARSRYGSDRFEVQYNVTDNQYSSCFLFLTIVWNDSYSSECREATKSGIKYTINLANIAPASVEHYETKGGFGMLQIPAAAEKSFVRRDMDSVCKSYTDNFGESSRKTNVISIRLDDLGIGQRVVTALQYAAKLCGAQDDVF